MVYKSRFHLGNVQTEGHYFFIKAYILCRAYRKNIIVQFHMIHVL